MISKAKSCPGGTALFNYVVNDLKGYELLRNGLSGITPKEMYSDMSIIQKQNLRCSNNTISIVLSPTIEDSRRMTFDQLKELTAGFLKELELDRTASQFIAFVHTEKEHKHVHILLNRVKADGTLINDSFISKKAQAAAHRIAIARGFNSARDLKEAKERARKNAHTEVKNVIKTAHTLVLKKKPKNLKVYQKEMTKFGIQVLPTINKQGKIQGFRFIHQETGTNLKASEVDRKLGLNQLFTNETPSNEKGLEKDQLVQAHSLNTSAFSSVLSQLAFDAGEIPDEHSKKNRKRKETSINR